MDTNDLNKVFAKYFEASIEAWMGRKNPLFSWVKFAVKAWLWSQMVTCIRVITMSTQNINWQYSPSKTNTLAYAEQQKFGFAKKHTLHVNIRGSLNLLVMVNVRKIVLFALKRVSLD